MLQNIDNSAPDGDAAPDFKALNESLNQQRYGHTATNTNTRRAVVIGTASDATGGEQRTDERDETAPDWKKIAAQESAARYGHAARDGGQK